MLCAVRQGVIRVRRGREKVGCVELGCMTNMAELQNKGFTYFAYNF